MKLDAYIRKTGTTEQAIADASGYSQGTINKLRNGKLNPTLELLSAINIATNGAVTPNDFLPFRPSSAGEENLAPAAQNATAQDVTDPPIAPEAP